MPYQLDPDLLEAVASGPPVVPVAPADVERVDFSATSYDGATIPVRWYRPARTGGATAWGPAVVYLHGGGMIMASVDLYDRLVAGYVAETGVRMLSVDYRLAPENTRTRRRSKTASPGSGGSSITPPSSASIPAGSRSWATAAVADWRRGWRSWLATGT